MSRGHRKTIGVAVAAVALSPVPSCVPEIPVVHAISAPVADLPEVVAVDPVIDPVIEPDVQMSTADRENPAKVSGAALRKLGNDLGLSHSEMSTMTDEKIRAQLEYLYNEIHGIG